MLKLMVLVLFSGLFAGILISLEVGYRIGRRSSKRNPERGFEGVGAMEAAIFSLLGLLLAFSFSGATSRFDARRQLIVQEANAIATAYQRLDLAPTDQPELHHLFREYLDARLQGFQQILDRPRADEQFARAAQIERQIWTRALAAGREDPTQNVNRLLLPALNQMSDVANQRSVMKSSATERGSTILRRRRGSSRSRCGAATSSRFRPCTWPSHPSGRCCRPSPSAPTS
jgi:hypothetical protein